ncbi:MAG: hypothetical protein JWQ71_1466 [Pedosphaera sp.]|nr:hypothetical protein [Pedosphaera sp.]
MKITRINKIREHRIFDNFEWPTALPDFERFNLIYGWNGTGKTTLSNLFRSLERKESVTEGEIIFRIDGNNVPANSFSFASNLPDIRVFNRDYVLANVAGIQATGGFSPIFFLGEENIEKQKQLDLLKDTRIEGEKVKNERDSALAKAITDQQSFYSDQAKPIKFLLSSSGGNNWYNNYHKGYFEARCKELAALDPVPLSLTEKEEQTLKQQKDTKRLENISPITLVLPDLNGIRMEVEEILKLTVVSEVLKELSNDEKVAEWVKTGLDLHKGEKHTDTCRFCSSEIPAGRINLLEGHFNDAYNSFLNAANVLGGEIVSNCKKLRQPELPEKVCFYDNLTEEYSLCRQSLISFNKKAVLYLEELNEELSAKRNKPFEAVALADSFSKAPVCDDKSGESALSR